MELLYVWIDEYKNISKQGFNFSDKYHFTYDHEKDELAFEKRDGLPKDFWGKNVMNLTLLLGKNGAGKTSILEYLYKPYLNRGIYIFSSGVKGEKLQVLYEPSLLRIKDNNKFIYKRLNQDHAGTKGSKTTKYQNYFDNIKNIFYSPLFRGDKAGRYYNWLQFQPQVRTNKQIGNHLGDNNSSSIDISTEIEIYKSFNDFDIYDSNPFYHYNIRQTAKHLSFLANEDFKKAHDTIFKKKMPKLQISAKSSKISQSFFEKNDYSQLKSFFDYLENAAIIPNNPVQTFENKCLIGLIREFLMYSHVESKKLRSFLSHSWNIKNLHFIYNDSIEFLKADKSVEQRVKEMPNKIHEIAVRYKDHIYENGDFILLPESNLKDFQQYLPFNELKETKATMFDYRWTDLSSGELYLLTLLARFYEVAYISNLDSIYHIFIDEGETSLHPHWQKQYIKWITEYIPMMFPEKKIQFILATNNPIIASDVPSSNIVFLDVDKTTGKTTGRDKPLETHNTFAANIHTLYRESFFMEDGVMGAFALDKINACIDDLIKKEALSETRKDEIKSVISMVGEPILKEKLTQLYHQKYRLDYDSELEKIKKRLDDLEKGK